MALSLSRHTYQPSLCACCGKPESIFAFRQDDQLFLRINPFTGQSQWVHWKCVKHLGYRKRLAIILEPVPTDELIQAEERVTEVRISYLSSYEF